MNIAVTILYTLLGWMSCAIPSMHSAVAPVEHLRWRATSYHIANNEATAYLSLVDNIWYQDSMGITEIHGIHSYRDASMDTTFSVLLGYRFTDMRRKWAYEYRNMADTAEIVKKFSKADSAYLIGGWNFFGSGTIQFDSVRAIADTIIGGITYQKHRHILYARGNTIQAEALSRCDRKGSIFHLDVGLGNAIGCPVVKGITLTPDGRFPMSSVEIEFVSNTFPDSVRRVLDAWKRNVKQYPVQ